MTLNLRNPYVLAPCLGPPPKPLSPPFVRLSIGSLHQNLCLLELSTQTQLQKQVRPRGYIAHNGCCELLHLKAVWAIADTVFLPISALLRYLEFASITITSTLLALPILSILPQSVTVTFFDSLPPSLHTYRDSTAQPIYNTLFKRNSAFVGAIFAGAFTFSIGFDVLTSAFWDMHNRGVSLGLLLGSGIAQFGFWSIGMQLPECS